MSIELIRAEKSDAELLTELSKLSFEDDSVRFLDGGTGGPPGYDDLSATLNLIKYCDFYKIIAGEKITGGVIVYYEDKKCVLGRIFIDPAEQGKGYGKDALSKIEELYKSEKELYLDTPKMNRRTNSFYQKQGYTVYKNDDFLNYYKKSL